MTRPHHLSGRALLAALGLVVLVCALVLWARVGLAEPGRGAVEHGGLVLSTDRVHWSSSLTEPLFDPTQQWSPGEAGSRVVYVRNDGQADSQVQVSVTMHEEERAPASWAVVSSRSDTHGWTSMQQAGSATLLGGQLLSHGEVRRVELRARVDPLAADTAMTRELRIDVDVRPEATMGARANTSWTTWSLAADVRTRLIAASLGGLVALLGLGVARRNTVEEVA